jgi:Dolichyl-phosphate-mannose-protein mannosyltransferase
LRRALLLGAFVCLAWAALVFVTGGVDWSTTFFRLSSRDAFRPIVAAVALVIGYCFVAWDDVSAVGSHLEFATRRHARLISLALALATFIIGRTWGTDVAAGSDSYGYLSQADLWRTGHLEIDQSAFQPWPFDQWTLTPLGYRPGSAPNTIVPTYPPGLPLLVAASDLVIGPRGRFLLVPIFGALTVWLTFVLGSFLVDELVGVLACLLVAASPAFLYHLMWPMSDVPATAAWALAMAFALHRRPWLSGTMVGVALAIRPNLVLLSIGVGLVAISRSSKFVVERKSLGLFVLGIVPAAVGVALFNTGLYGAPWNFGYPEGLFSARNVWPNAVQYSRWLIQTQTPFLLLAIPLLASRHLAPANTRIQDPVVRTALSTFVIAIAASYLPYSRFGFEEWTYVRFVLPAIPLLLIAALGCLRSAKDRFKPAFSVVVLTLAVTLVFAWELTAAKSRGAFTIGSDLQHGVIVARDVGELTPEGSVLFSMFHSGTARYYGNRMTVRYDWLPENALDPAVDILSARGRRSYFLLESWEIELARQRFGDRSAIGRLDRPPVKQWNFSNGMAALYAARP